MDESTYGRWARSHAETFGIRTPEDLQMLRSWYEVLGHEDPNDLHEASRRLARSDYPSFARDHLKALTAFIRVLRAERLRGDPGATSSDDRGSCVKCGGSGRVIVPHPRGVQGREWVPLQIARAGATYYLACVCCSCALGRWYRENGTARRGGKDVAPMGLEEYERLNPEWQWQLSFRETHDREVDRLSRRSGQPVSRFEELLARLIESWKLPREESHG